MPGRSRVRTRARAVRDIQTGIRRLTRGLTLLAREIAREAAPRGHGLRRRVSLGRRLHGRYIGLIRNLPRQQKARVRAARARKGVEAAIRMARKLRGAR
jgi:hypothetical protein